MRKKKHAYIGTIQNKSIISLLPVLLMVTLISVIAGCKGNSKKNSDNELTITISANGEANGGHRFSKIDDSNFYVDDIKYTARNGDF